MIVIVTLLAVPLSATDSKVIDVCENVMPVLVDEPNVIDAPAAAAPKLVPWTVMIVAVDEIGTHKIRNTFVRTREL